MTVTKPLLKPRSAKTRNKAMLVMVVHSPYPSAPRTRATMGMVIMFRTTETTFAKPEVTVAKRRERFLLSAAVASSLGRKMRKTFFI
jgi:hypothetical protein